MTAGASDASLTQDELDMLAMERLWWQFAGVKEQKIRERFNMSALRYYQVLNELINRDDVLAHDPLLVKRLRRIRAQRKRSRSPQRLGVDL